MFAQPAPLALQRCHWYWKAVGLLLQVPFCAVSVSPTRRPCDRRSAVLAGGAATAAPAQTPRRRSPSQSSSAFVVIFTVEILSSGLRLVNDKTGAGCWPYGVLTSRSPRMLGIRTGWVAVEKGKRHEGERMRRILLTLVLLALAAHRPGAGGLPEEDRAAGRLRPEGLEIGNGNTFYVGSVGTGAVYTGDLRTGSGRILIAGVPTCAPRPGSSSGRPTLGLGRPLGNALLYNAKTGALIKEIQLATGPARPSSTTPS